MKKKIKLSDTLRNEDIEQLLGSDLNNSTRNFKKKKSTGMNSKKSSRMWAAYDTTQPKIVDYHPLRREGRLCVVSE